MKSHLEYLFLRALASIVLLCPWSWIYHIGNVIGAFTFSVLRVRRTLTMENLRWAFPEKSEEEREQIALESYQNLFVAFLEVYWFPRLTPEKVHSLMAVEGTELLEKARAEGRGVILITAHCGNWELGAVKVGLIAPAPLTVIVQEQSNKYVSDFVNRARSIFGNHPVLMQDAPREILRALRRNEFVGIVADQSAAKEALRVKFFGRFTPTHDGPAVFSLRTGAPILMAYATRLPGGRYRAELEAVDLTGITGTDEEKICEITQRHVAALEGYVRKHPGQWLWLHRRWKHSTE
ncbi:MAG: lysophospholipid acyltransferase family protein [Ignavibacteriales bacterium]|nr:lysophospholipid acyltransferase family protein [Ignavibacteriales bacterium]